MLQRKRPSQRAANVAYYWRNRDIEITRVRLRQQGTVHMLRELRRVACADCGGRFEPHQMDFDHRDPATKSFDVMSGRAMLKSQQELLAEVAKCDVVCVNCHRVRSRDSHRARLTERGLTGRSPQIERRRANWRRQAALLDRIRDVACADCGGRFPACAMDFDHRDPTTKTSRVTSMIGRAGDTRILAELAKCDIVCGNCHRLRTYDRRDGSRLERE